jgi:hypothetical protein
MAVPGLSFVLMTLLALAILQAAHMVQAEKNTGKNKGGWQPPLFLMTVQHFTRKFV